MKKEILGQKKKEGNVKSTAIGVHEKEKKEGV